jgi:FkbM family methyltransferase
MQRLKDFIRKIVYGILHGILSPPYIPSTYAQAGEDAVLRFLFEDFGITTIKYLDIGCNTPNYGNNTYLFYTNGSTGVCVEANPSLINKIKTIRPKDKVIHAGVSVLDEKEADLYVFNVPAISTFNKQEAEQRSSFGNYKVEQIIKVPLITINNLIDDNFSSYPDLLSIDIEGFDYPVLQSLNYTNYPIPVICVETCTYSENHIRPKNLSIANFMATKGYEVYADTYINTIFVNKKWFYNK